MLNLWIIESKTVRLRICGRTGIHNHKRNGIGDDRDLEYTHVEFISVGGPVSIDRPVIFGQRGGLTTGAV